MDPTSIEEAVSAHRAHLLRAFQAGDWDAVARSYGATGPTRRDELRAALTAVVAWARELGPDAVLAGRLATLTDEVMEGVDGPPTGPRAGLAALFANATASTGWWAERTCGARAVVATCASCGASQTRPLAFTCVHCGCALYGEAP